MPKYVESKVISVLNSLKCMQLSSSGISTTFYKRAKLPWKPFSGNDHELWNASKAKCSRLIRYCAYIKKIANLFAKTRHKDLGILCHRQNTVNSSVEQISLALARQETEYLTTILPQPTIRLPFDISSIKTSFCSSGIFPRTDHDAKQAMPGFQIVSDLHLEIPNRSYDVFNISPAAPNLALLGDIGLVSHQEELRGFVIRHLYKFKRIFYVLGNHEAYHSTWASAVKFLEETKEVVEEKRLTEQGLGQFVPLHRNRYDFDDDVTVLGCTLFSHVPLRFRDELRLKLNDFYQIGDDWMPDKHSNAHNTDVAWLNDQVVSLRGSGRKIVVFTHHSPTKDQRANDPRHDLAGAVSSGFVTDLSTQECWRSPDVVLWAFGHTHFNCDYLEPTNGATKRVYTNQRGYCHSQSPGYDQERVVQI